MRMLLGISVIAMAAWILVPDKISSPTLPSRRAGGVMAVTTILFFLAEIGDKTQIATVALAARFDSLAAVVLGTTIGMMVANAPVAFWGGELAARLPVRAIHVIAALLFVSMGIAVLVFG